MSEHPGSAAGLRAANRDRVLMLLRSEGPMSQAELARASALSPATISSIVRELRDDGWLEAAESAPARGSLLALSRSAGFAVAWTSAAPTSAWRSPISPTRSSRKRRNHTTSTSPPPRASPAPPA